MLSSESTYLEHYPQNRQNNNGKDRDDNARGRQRPIQTPSPAIGEGPYHVHAFIAETTGFMAAIWPNFRASIGR
jgi:hypothetical protein